MVLESNRDLVQRRLIECLSRDRTKHQVAEITSLGLVRMTRKKLGLGLLETFSEPCEVCAGRGVIVFNEPVTRNRVSDKPAEKSRRGGSGAGAGGGSGRSRGAVAPSGEVHAIPEGASSALAKIAASTLAQADDASAASSQASGETTEVMEILDIPVTITKGRRKKSDVSSTALDSVLDALPEPSDPGKGRPKRRRVSTDSITAEVTEPAV
jgi:ribonuclease E